MHVGRRNSGNWCRARTWAVGAAFSMVVAGCAAQTDPATVSGPTEARLNAHGHTDGSAAHYEFQYATDAPLLGTHDGFLTPTRGPVPAHTPATGDAVFGERVQGLRPGTTYAYRVCGGDARIAPDVCDATKSFTTPPGTPAVDFVTSSPATNNSFVGPPAVADFNRDGNLDFAASVGGSPVGSPPSGPLLLFLGDGRGSFAKAVSRSLPPGLDAADATAAGDFDNDGKPDLAVVGNTPLGNQALILRGDGTGAFTAGPRAAVDGRTTQLVPADLDRDGRLDLAAVVEPPSHVVVLRGDGTGRLTASSDLDRADQPAKVAVRDMNHDGIADLVVVTSFAEVSVLLGDGRGGFGPPRRAVGSGNSPRDLVVGDVNRDGNRDVVTSNALFLGDGTGGLGSAKAIQNSPDSALALADFNSDGRLDLAGGVDGGRAIFGGVAPRIRVLLGNGDSTFQTPNEFDCGEPSTCDLYAGGYADSVAIDLFHDGRPSLLSVGDLGDGSSTFGIVTVARNTTSR